MARRSYTDRQRAQAAQICDVMASAFAGSFPHDIDSVTASLGLSRAVRELAIDALAAVPIADTLSQWAEAAAWLREGWSPSTPWTAADRGREGPSTTAPDPVPCAPGYVERELVTIDKKLYETQYPRELVTGRVSYANVISLPPRKVSSLAQPHESDCPDPSEAQGVHATCPEPVGTSDVVPEFDEPSDDDLAELEEDGDGFDYSDVTEQRVTDERDDDDPVVDSDDALAHIDHEIDVETMERRDEDEPDADIEIDEPQSWDRPMSFPAMASRNVVETGRAHVAASRVYLGVDSVSVHVSIPIGEVP
jgi:hypothetical protein